jgi:hypothetical protein
VSTKTKSDFKIDILKRFVKSRLKVALKDSILEFVLQKPGSFWYICQLLKTP